MKKKLQGIMPAVGSPCDENDVFLEDKFIAMMESLCDSGVHGYYVCGGTGDGLKMPLAERKRAAELAIDIAGKHNQTVIVQVGANNTRPATELARHAAEAGADVVSSVPLKNCSQKQLISYYSDIAKASGLPVLVYHFPNMTGYTPSVDEMVEIMDIDGVVGCKFTDWNLFFLKRVLLARPEKIVFSGFDELLCPALLYGAVGGIGTNYGLYPKLFLGIYNAVQAGDLKKAMDLQQGFLLYTDLLWQVGIEAGFEYQMRMRGLGPYTFRKPREEFDAKTAKYFEAELPKRLAAFKDLVD